MTQIEKLYARLLASQRPSLSFRDFEALLLGFGFELVRTRGSHKTYVHPECQRPMTIQPLGKDAKRYQVEQFLDMVEEFRLSLKD